MYFKSIRVYNLETKSELWWKCWHYIMGYIIKVGSIIFLFALVSSLAYIEDRLCQIWSVYMQYLRCYDHSNKCLFLVIQQAEVLLNFFWGVYMQFCTYIAQICTHLVHVFGPTGIILCMRPIDERRHYNITSSIIGWAHTHPCVWA